MFFKKWEELPEKMQNEKVRPYYDSLKKQKNKLVFKRVFDIVCALLALIIFLPIMFVVAIAIKLDSPGNVFFRQERITAYGKKFRIWKFRSMVSNAEERGSQVTVEEDKRVTKVGKFIRRYRLDEIPQLFNILAGDMTFVGVRPEVEKYVKHYSEEMYATLLLPAGVTSEASIRYKDENNLLTKDVDVDMLYIQQIMPGKMYYNLKAIKEFTILGDIKTMMRTALAVCGKEYEDVREDIAYGKNTRA